MKTNEKNISLKEALQLNHRAYKLFYQYYPKINSFPNQSDHLESTDSLYNHIFICTCY